MKAMHRHGCADLALTQQAERLLGDDALQQYSNAFTPEARSRRCSWDWGPESVSPLQHCPQSVPQDAVSEPRGMPNQNVEVNQPVSPLEEHAGVQATQPPAAPGLNEDLDTTQVRTTKKTQAKMIVGNKGKRSGLCILLSFLNVILSSSQPTLSADGPLQTTRGHNDFTFHHPEAEGKSPQRPTSFHGASLGPGRPGANTGVVSRRRLSSPEKIMDLQEQLQKTVMSRSRVLCAQDFSPSVNRLPTTANRGSGWEARKYLSFSTPSDLLPTLRRKKESLSFSAPHTQQSAAPSPSDKPPTFNNGDAFHSADLFTGHHFKTDNPESPGFQLTTLTPANSPDAHPETTASDTAAPDGNCSDTLYTSDRAAPERGTPLSAATCTPEKSNNSERKSSAALENRTVKRPKAGPPHI